MKYAKIIILIGILAIISVFLYLYLHSARVSPPPIGEKRPSSKYKIKGIDVSHHQGRVDWSKVKKSGVDFVILKSSEAGNHVDTCFEYNLRQARVHKIPVVAYHYYRFNRSPEVQFLHYKSLVPRDLIDLPPVIDVEYHSNEALKDPSNKPRFLQELRIFQALLEKHYGKKPIIYTDVKFYEELMKGAIDERLWMSDMRTMDLGYLDSTQWVFWQYSMRGKVPGIEKEVDLNVFNGDMNKLLKL